MANARFGRCALTHSVGRYVKSHIIPKALTEQIWRGEPLTQRGRNGRLIKRWDSWYDSRLVTDQGEAILASYDDFAVNLLRRHKLVWSSWGLDFELNALDHTWHEDHSFGLRSISNVDARKFRLFLLSLLWRAAATTLFEFGTVEIEPGDLEQLRLMVLMGQVEPQIFYPATLIQLCSRSFPHNRSAYRSSKREPTIFADGQPDFENMREVPHFRFWLDGLIVHFHLAEDEATFESRRTVFVGPSEDLKFITLRAEKSAQMNWFWEYTANAN